MIAAVMKKATEFATADEYVVHHTAWRASQGVETSEQQIEGLRDHWQDSINAAKRRKGIHVPGRGNQSNYGNGHGRYINR